MPEPRMTLAYSQEPMECECCGDVFENYGKTCRPCWRAGCSAADDGRPCLAGGGDDAE